MSYLSLSTNRPLDGFFDDFWRSFERSIYDDNSSGFARLNKDGSTVITLSLPGVDPSTINVDLDPQARRLSVRYELDGAKHSRSYTLGSKLDLDKLSAVHRFGLLKIEVPPMSESPPAVRSIDVKVLN